MKIIILDVYNGGLSQDTRFILIPTSEGCMEIMKTFTLTPLGKKDQSLKFHQKIKLIFYLQRNDILCSFLVS